MKKFRNTYRIPSARLPGWDYRNAGAYFITICTQNRDHFFGECTHGKVKLSTAGMIAQGCWYQIPYLSPNADLGAFVVMPNHVHGILVLDDMGKNDGDGDNCNGIDDNGVETFESNVSTPLSNANDISKHNKNEFFQNICPELDFEWQTRFYDHIIRNSHSFQNISNYIINNPINWKDDKFYNTSS